MEIRSGIPISFILYYENQDIFEVNAHIYSGSGEKQFSLSTQTILYFCLPKGRKFSSDEKPDTGSELNAESKRGIFTGCILIGNT